MIEFNDKPIIRPSVSIVPIDDSHIDFFLSSTRKNFRTKLSAELQSLVKSLNGEMTLDELIKAHDLESGKVKVFLDFLVQNSVVESSETRLKIEMSDSRRTLNFIGDLVQYTDVFKAQETLLNANVCILGLGAVGSLVAIQLAQMGVKNFTLIDSDCVEISNLNRSVFDSSDIGKLKTSALKKRLNAISSDVSCTPINSIILNIDQLTQVLDGVKLSCLVNCADYPNADITNDFTNAYCASKNIPLVIAGGYNLHLSIIGTTVIPHETACVNCGKLTLDEIGESISKGVQKLIRKDRNLGNLAPLSAITSSFCSLEIFRVLLRKFGIVPAMINRRGEYNFFGGKITFTDLPPRDECGCLRT